MKNLFIYFILGTSLAFSSFASNEVSFKNLPNGSPKYADPNMIDISELESETKYEGSGGKNLKNYEFIFQLILLHINNHENILKEIEKILENKSISTSNDGGYLYEIVENQRHAKLMSDHLSDLITIYISLGESECLSQKPLLASKIHSLAGSLMIRHLFINARMEFFKVESKRDPVINIVNKFDKQLPSTILRLEKLIKSIKLKSDSGNQEDESKSVEPKPSLKTP
jgi:hypothetical protein